VEKDGTPQEEKEARGCSLSPETEVEGKTGEATVSQNPSTGCAEILPTRLAKREGLKRMKTGEKRENK